jgi:predicted transposase/invertase (TIGR01784 family)
MLKCFEGENTSMCEAIRQMVDEGIMLGEKRGEERGEERGKKQGSMNEKLIIARRMLEKNYPMEQVVDLTMLTKQEVEELSRTIKS